MLLSHAVTWVARQAANWYMYMEGLPLQHEVLLITESAAAVPSGYEVRIAAYSNIHSVNFNIWIPQFETDVSAVVSSTQSGGPDQHFHQVAECSVVSPVTAACCRRAQPFTWILKFVLTTSHHTRPHHRHHHNQGDKQELENYFWPYWEANNGCVVIELVHKAYTRFIYILFHWLLLP